MNAAAEKWGVNEFEFPMPTFDELLREQLLAPFFVFQAGGGRLCSLCSPHPCHVFVRDCLCFIEYPAAHEVFARREGLSTN